MSERPRCPNLEKSTVAIGDSIPLGSLPRADLRACRCPDRDAIPLTASVPSRSKAITRRYMTPQKAKC